MNDVHPDHPGTTRRRLTPTFLIPVIVVTALLLGACGDDDSRQSVGSDPAEVIEEYRLAYNSGDIETVMALFAEESVITGHPLASHQSGLDEIREIQVQDIALASTEDAYAISNVQVSGDVVTWDHVWTRRDGSEACVEGHGAVIEGGKIVSWTWPDTDFQCS